MFSESFFIEDFLPRLVYFTVAENFHSEFMISSDYIKY